MSPYKNEHAVVQIYRDYAISWRQSKLLDAIEIIDLYSLDIQANIHINEPGEKSFTWLNCSNLQNDQYYVK